MTNNGPTNDEKETSPTPETLRRIAAVAATPPANGSLTSRMVGQFILFPLAIVLVCAAIYLLYGLLTQEERSARDLLNEVRAGGASRRWQAAYSLAAMMTRPNAKDMDARLVQEILRAFEESKTDDPRIRQYLALSLGRLGDKQATQILVGALDDAHDETRISAIWSLGELRDSSSVMPLLRQAESDDPGIKKITAHSLGLIQDDRALPTLRGMLSATVPDVRWNAALALCRFQDR